jgi:hypothetical protein
MPELKLIDKTAAYRALKHEAESYWLSFSAEAYDRAARIIDQMPTLEAEPVRRGRWDEIQCFSEHGVEMASYECTSCGNDIERQRGVLPQYCEFCGARMDGGDHSACD